jgi:hypothetical protein
MMNSSSKSGKGKGTAGGESNGGKKTTSEKLGLGPEVRELKFGAGFTSGGGERKGKGGAPSFHAIK